MPRHDHRVTLETVLSYQERMLLVLLIQQLNVLRRMVDLPPVTAQDLRQDVRAYLQAHPRNEAS
jgi:hypothetical protein